MTVLCLGYDVMTHGLLFCSAVRAKNFTECLCNALDVENVLQPDNRQMQRNTGFGDSIVVSPTNQYIFPAV